MTWANHFPEYEQCRSVFEAGDPGFRNGRQAWIDLLERNLPSPIPASIKGTKAAKDRDLRSSELENSLFAHVDKLLTNPVYIDLNLISSQSEAAKKVARGILLWTAHFWAEFNHDRWFDRSTAEDQCKLGLGLTRLIVNQWPDEEKYKDLGDRDKLMRKIRHIPTLGEYVSPLNVCWLDNGTLEPEVFYYEYEKPLLRAVKEYGQEEAAEWYGAPLDDLSRPGIQNEKVHVIIRDAPDPSGKMCPCDGCDHVQRVITEVVYGTQDVKDAHEVNEYQSPYPGPSFILTPGRGGNRSDVHQRFRPLMLMEYDYVTRQNFLDSLILNMVITNYSRKSADVSSLGPEHQAWLDAVTEGGKESSIAWQEEDSNRLSLMPKLQDYMTQLDPHLQLMRDETARRLDEAKPNRFITGRAFEEAQRGTGTAFVEGEQAAQAPYSTLLMNHDASVRRILKYVHHQIRWEDATSTPATERKYYALSTGGENLMSGEAKAGEIAWISKSRLEEIDFDLVLETSAETLAEEARRWALAKDKMGIGVMVPEQLVRAAGYRDVRAQMRELLKAQERAKMAPFFETQRLAFVQKRLMLMSEGGWPPPATLPAPVMGNGAPGAQAPQPGASMTEMTGRHINPPPIEAASGGTEVTR